MLKSSKIEKQFSILRTVFSISLALIIAFILIYTVSDNPFKDFSTLLFGPLKNTSRIITVISKTIPLLFTGVAVSLIYSAGQINIAAEGAFFSGCIAATCVAIIPNIPPIIHIPLCLLAGFIVGSIVMGIPGIMHVKYDVVTIVSSLMINYVPLYGGLYIILNPLRDGNAGFEASLPFSLNAILPKLFNEERIHLGLIIGILVVIIGVVLLFKTPFGYEIRTVGQNAKFAKLSGIKTDKVIILTSLLAGGIAGIGGSVEILGNYNRFVYPGFTNHGWDGIMIAVLCRNNPKSVPFAALFLAYIKTAADSLNLTSSIPIEIVSIIQAVIIIFIAAERLLAGLEHKKIVEASKNNLKLEEVK